MAQRTKTEPPAHRTRLVRNQSARFGPVTAIIVHSTESQDIPGTDRDLVAIRNWFDNPASQASSHIGIDGDGHTEVWVHSNRKAWTAGAANGFAVQIEFVARAAQTRVSWEEAQIKAGARWAAYWAIKYKIPLQVGRARNVNGQCVCSKKGVLRHSDITAAGFGSHTDPGKGFPMARFLELARWYRKNGWEV